jgi:glyoxylase-like metal-dependent hydrolase (beta-lactamase superfamily II)
LYRAQRQAKLRIMSLPAQPAISYGQQLLPDLFVVSWLGMIPGQIDCHVFVLRSSQGLLLIDAGTPWGHGRLLENLAHWQLAPAEIRTVLLTHGHVDHVSGAYHFAAQGAEILSHRELQSMIECQWEATGVQPSGGGAYRVAGYLEPGTTLTRCGFEITVLASPGHTRHCLSFLITVNGGRCLFSGDLLMGNAQPGWHGDPGYDPVALQDSLRRLLQEDFQHLCYGHGVVLNDRGALFRRALASASTWPERPPITGRHPAR